MKNSNKVNKDFYEPNMKQVQTDEAISTINGNSVMSKSISDRLNKMESMLLHSIDKMEIIDKKLDNFINNINIRMIGKTGDDIFKIY